MSSPTAKTLALLRELGYDAELHGHASWHSPWECIMGRYRNEDDWYSGSAKTASLAICRAALAAVGVTP